MKTLKIFKTEYNLCYFLHQSSNKNNKNNT